MRTHRKRRIRKKWKIGEFTEFGFCIFGKLASDPVDFMNRLIVWVEAHNIEMFCEFDRGEFDATVVRSSLRTIRFSGKEIEDVVAAFAEAGATEILASNLFDINRPLNISSQGAFDQILAALENVEQLTKDLSFQIETSTIQLREMTP